MSASSILTLWSNSIAVSVIVWLMMLVITLYIARKPAHRVLMLLFQTFHQSMRISAKSLRQAEHRLAQRNREVLLNSGREAMEHVIEREFERVDATVRRELAEYPTLHHQLSTVATKFEEDYLASAQVPPAVPGWEKAVEAVAKIPSRGDAMVADVLENIHESMKSAYHRALGEYRKTSHEYHTLLKRMMPGWRQVTGDLQRVDTNVNSLIQRCQKIDSHMAEYESILKREDRALRTLSSSSMTQFFIAAFVLLIAIGGAMINFNLIAHPMQEMVGGSSHLMGFKTSNIAALVIILVEVAMGLFLMESLRITRLFPVIGAMSDKMRLRMVWITFAILFMLASVESGLAYMREVLAQDDAALRSALLSEQGVLIADTSSRWITTAAQMGMGFILPFALTFVAIPLESFIHSARTVLGVLGIVLLRGLAFSLRLLGNLAKQVGVILPQLYDLVICVPLWVEHAVTRSRVTSKAKPAVEQQVNMDNNLLPDKPRVQQPQYESGSRQAPFKSDGDMMGVPL